MIIREVHILERCHEESLGFPSSCRAAIKNLPVMRSEKYGLFGGRLSGDVWVFKDAPTKEIKILLR